MGREETEEIEGRQTRSLEGLDGYIYIYRGREREREREREQAGKDRFTEVI